MSGLISPAQAFAHVDPEFIKGLSRAEKIILFYKFNFWARPEQLIPRKPWRMLGMRAGRGWGKTAALVPEITRFVESGEARSIALVGPTDERVSELQIASLIKLAPPWFRPEERGGNLVWPNGAEAITFSAETEGRTRGGNFDLTWCTELVDWGPKRLLVWKNVTTATRRTDGRPARVIYDTTSRGRNPLIALLSKDHARDPRGHIVINGMMFDNPLYASDYIRAECAKYVPGSQSFREELMGEEFNESAAALWKYEYIEDHRRELAPTDYELKIVSLDPAQSSRKDADETGLVVVCRTANGHQFVLEDLSGHIPAETWARAVVDQCETGGASGVVTERNNSGEPVHDLIKVIAAQRGIRIEDIPPERDFPLRTPGRIYFKEYTATRSKHQRAEAPAALYVQGLVHHVGVFEQLENEMTSWEPDNPKSPNRLDALAYAVAELARLKQKKVADPNAIAGAVEANRILARGRAPSSVVRPPPYWMRGKLGL